MSGPWTLLVHEPTSLWTAEFERQLLPDPGLRIRWRPDFGDLLAESTRQTLAVLVLSPEEESLEKVSQLHTRTAGILCLIAGEDFPWEKAARELGADVVLPETTTKYSVLDSLRKLLRSRA